MKIGFEGREWELDVEAVTVKQAMVLHLAYKMTLRDFMLGLEAVDPRSFQFAYWLMLQQNGVVKPLADCDIKVFQFAAAFAAGQEAETAQEHGHAGQPCDLDEDGRCTLQQDTAEPDPTQPPKTPGEPASQTFATPATTTLQLPGQQAGTAIA